MTLGGFPPRTLAALRTGRSLRIRAGTSRHRFIGIWVVVVQGRVFVRSWSRQPRSWWRTLLEEPQGAIRIASRTVPFRAVRTRSDRLKKAVDAAYIEKYGSGAQRRYALDLIKPACRATTTELVAS